MTEEEAKAKVCPVGAMRGSYDGNWDKGSCIGSKCMAWRWSSKIGSENRPGKLGYCGLAGKP